MNDVRPERVPRPDLEAGDVVEVPLLLPGWQVSALEEAAHDRGLTAGEMVRQLVRQFLGQARKVEAI